MVLLPVAYTQEQLVEGVFVCVRRQPVYMNVCTPVCISLCLHEYPTLLGTSSVALCGNTCTSSAISVSILTF